MGYQLLALLTKEASVTLDVLLGLLREKFSSDVSAVVRLEDRMPLMEGRYIAVRWGEWSFSLDLNDASHVVEESREIAEESGMDRPDRDIIKTCRRRVELASDDDPGMDHFNDYLYIAEVLESLPGVILFDPQIEAFWDAM